MITETDERVEKMRKAAEEFEGRMESMWKAGVDMEAQVAEALAQLTAMGLDVDSRAQSTLSELMSKFEEVSIQHATDVRDLTVQFDGFRG